MWRPMCSCPRSAAPARSSLAANGALISDAHRATPCKTALEERPMTALLNTVDPDGLLEFSVVFTDLSLIHI